MVRIVWARVVCWIRIFVFSHRDAQTTPCCEAELASPACGGHVTHEGNRGWDGPSLAELMHLG